MSAPLSELDVFPPYDGSEPLERWKLKRERDLKIWRASQSPLLELKSPDGAPLYRLTSGGNIVRSRAITPRTRARVLERDGSACVKCGAGAPLEIDHIIRYADGGTEDLENLQALCVPCHRSKGGK